MTTTPGLSRRVHDGASDRQGQGPEALGGGPLGVLVLSEVATDFEVGPGDTLPITIYPDDFEKSTNLKLHVHRGRGLR